MSTKLRSNTIKALVTEADVFQDNTSLEKEEKDNTFNKTIIINTILMSWNFLKSVMWE